MSYEYISPEMSGVAATVVGRYRVEQRAKINIGASEEEIRGHTTWQLQQLRRAARAEGRLPWRDNQILADEILDLTRQLLQARGAWTARQGE